MGLFSWFKAAPGNVSAQSDKLWLTKGAKFQGISQAIQRSLAAPQPPSAVLLVAHFPDCLENLRQIAARFPATSSVLTVDAQALQELQPPPLPESGSKTIQILAAERHPLRARDDAILEFARGFPCRCTITYHLSLEDAVMRKLAGERVTAMLRRLGARDDEAIESRVVSRQLQAAQQKLLSKCLHDYPAESAEAWLERNCPNA